MTPILGCIADDFTGATDLASLLARSGLPVTLRIGIPDSPTATAPFEVIALKCRTSPVAEAVSETLQALDWLKATGAERFYWKYCSTFDSTATGNIGPVAEALMRALGTDQTIYAPSFPENGRTVYQGNLFVAGLPLNESPMKDHPLTPMRDANLMRLLEPQTTAPVGLARWATVRQGAAVLASVLEDLRAQGCAHVVMDALDDPDLATIAQACVTYPLLTGGSALAMHLPALYAAAGLIGEGQSRPAIPSLAGSALVLSGSCSAMTRAQVAHFAARAPSLKLDPLDLARDGSALENALAWLSAEPTTTAKLIYATADPSAVAAAQARLGAERAGKLVEDALAHLARQALAQGTARFVVAGGETSGAVTQALGVDSLTIGPEIAPGVPWTFAQAKGAQIALALKSGNFGTEDFFTRALDILPG